MNIPRSTCRLQLCPLPRPGLLLPVRVEHPDLCLFIRRTFPLPLPPPTSTLPAAVLGASLPRARRRLSKHRLAGTRPAFLDYKSSAGLDTSRSSSLIALITHSPEEKLGLGREILDDRAARSAGEKKQRGIRSGISSLATDG